MCRDKVTAVTSPALSYLHVVLADDDLLGGDHASLTLSEAKQRQTEGLICQTSRCMTQRFNVTIFTVMSQNITFHFLKGDTRNPGTLTLTQNLLFSAIPPK